MSEQTLADRVIDHIADALELMPSEVRPGCKFRDDFGANTTAMLILREVLMEAFGFYIPRFAIRDWQEVQDVITYMDRRINGRAA